MSIKIVIERKFKEAVVPETLEIIHEIRVKALRDRGYIGGETVVNVNDDREVLVFLLGPVWMIGRHGMKRRSGRN